MSKFERINTNVCGTNVNIVISENGKKFHSSSRVKMMNVNPLVSVLKSCNIPVTVIQTVRTQIINGVVSEPKTAEMVIVEAECSGESIHRLLEAIKNSRK